MEASFLQSVVQIPRALASPSSVENEQSKIVVPRNLGDQFSSLVVNNLPRRSFLQFSGFSPISLYVCPVLAAQILEMKEPEVIRIQNSEACYWSQDSRYC